MAQRGRPFQPDNKFGRGRPPGSRNKTTILAQNLLNSRAEPIAAKVAAMALQGDPTAMRLAMERILPVRRDVPVKLGAMPTKTASDVSRAFEKVLEKVASGKLSASDGHAWGELLEKRRRALETAEIDQRVRALEGKREDL